MFRRTTNCLLVIIGAGLVGALTIDNQLTVIKNDCFERLAIGQRLKPKDVYNTLELNTVPECQKECTNDQEKCRTFSFGIGVKGNASCELSIHVIKETVDLKPIGTTPDADFDLYIKKLGCKLVIDQKQPHGAILPNDVQHDGTEDIAHDTYSVVVSKPTQPTHELYTQDYHHGRPSNRPGGGGDSYGASDTYRPQFDSSRPPHHRPEPSYGGTNQPDRPDVLQTTLISIRPDPNRPAYTGLGPAFGYFNSDRPRPDNPNRPSNGYNDRPHIRPYDDDRPSRPSNGYHDHDAPKPHYDRPLPPSNSYNDRPNNDYGGDRPSYEHDRPTRPDYNRPMRPYEDRPLGYEFGNRPVRPYDEISSERPYSRPHANGYESDHERPYNSRPFMRPDHNYDDPRPVTFHQKPYDTDRYDDRPTYIRPNDYNDDDRRPPFRPSSLNHPYHEKPYFRPTPNDYDPGPSKPRPGRPSERPDFGYNDGKPRPDLAPYDRPEISKPRPDYDRPHHDRPHHGRPSLDHHRPERPYDDKPDRPEINKPRPDYDRPLHDRPSLDHHRPERPYDDKPDRPYDPNNPNIQSQIPDVIKPVSEATYKGDPDKPNKANKGADANKINGNDKPNNSHTKVTHSIGPHGQSITAIITEIEPCFRRSLAGKKVSRAMVRREMPCERVEECQLECSDEKRFVCEGFNYRLDPAGSGRGDCELLDLPLIRIDIRRDVYPDPDYDVYERDRNASPGCMPMDLYERDRYRDRGRDRDRMHEYDRYDGMSRRHDYIRPYHDRDRDRRPGYIDDRRMADRRGDGYYHDSMHYNRPHHNMDRHYLPKYQPRPYLPKHHYQPAPYLPKRHDYKETYYHDRERDRNHWGFNMGDEMGGNGWGSYGGSYGNFGRPDSYYGNINRHDTNNRRNYYLPNKAGGNRDWGTYGGSYGTGGHSYGGQQSWGLNKQPGYGIPSPYDNPQTPALHGYGTKPAYFGGQNGNYLPNTGVSNTYVPKYGTHGLNYGGSTPNSFKPSPSYGGNYGTPGPSYTYGQVAPSYGSIGQRPVTVTAIASVAGHRNNPNQILENTFYSGAGDVPEHKKFGPLTKESHVGYNFLKDECSLRTATGFRLHKIIVKKLYMVPNINECEMLCFKETYFECLSYAYRYTLSTNQQNDNCYLSSRNYKELDFYTDLEPDRNFDIYTMNNQKMCGKSMSKTHDNSECFWHIRSGQRLEQTIVRDSMSVNNIVDCQLECLRSTSFLCRSFSFRYGSPRIGGSIDNCQLTDWPFMELDPRTQLIPEPGFEIYERGSFGHGCEPNHFSIRGKDNPTIGSNTDQLCYVGYGTPARLLPQATKKTLYVTSELDCKAECTKTRHETLFQCMSFSFRSKSERGGSNCDLSDILQRDLLSDVDYVGDTDSWLFAWDTYNPECVAIADSSHNLVGTNYIGRDDAMDISRYDPGLGTAMDTWRVYSVSGWPCRRGSMCTENREAGFWSCQLEGGDENTWDYCCHPDHHCGYSEGFNYQWCYVGPDRTQWRKCSDQYFPYISNLMDRHDYNQQPQHVTPEPYLPINYGGDAPPFIAGRPTNNDFAPSFDPASRPGFRPDRPQSPPRPPPPRKPSLNEYEQTFNMQFLDPPKPGGFNQPRYWPVSYLHKENPPNQTKTFDRMKTSKNMDNRYTAIQNLIEIIKSNDINNIQYKISNQTSKNDDILVVHIPLPTNFTQDSKKSEKMMKSDNRLSLPIDLPTNQTNKPKSASKIKDLSGNRGPRPDNDKTNDSDDNTNKKADTDKSSSNLSVRQVSAPLYRRSYITRTNVSSHGRHFSLLETEPVQFKLQV